MNASRIIRAKRDGEPLEPEAIDRFIRDFVAGRVPDYQMSAFLMAV
jgi:thymidine phosphorylase